MNDLIIIISNKVNSKKNINFNINSIILHENNLVKFDMK